MIDMVALGFIYIWQKVYPVLVSDQWLRHSSLWVITSNASTISCGSLLILSPFFKICRMVVCSVRGTYNHVSTFLSSQEQKKYFFYNIDSVAVVYGL